MQARLRRASDAGRDEKALSSEIEDARALREEQRLADKRSHALRMQAENEAARARLRSAGATIPRKSNHATFSNLSRPSTSMSMNRSGTPSMSMDCSA